MTILIALTLALFASGSAYVGFWWPGWVELGFNESAQYFYPSGPSYFPSEDYARFLLCANGVGILIGLGITVIGRWQHWWKQD